MSLASLPEVSFCETDAAKVREWLLATHQAITGRTLYPGNPERLWLEFVAEVITRQRVIIDHTGKMNLLRYASGAFLDHKGAERQTARLAAAPAMTTLRFSLTTPLDYPVAIPAGTRATPDGQLMFATSGYAEIKAKDEWIDVEAVCLEAGSQGNGLLPSQVNRLVDPLAHVAKVANTTTTTGGADVETDEAYRERIRQAPEGYSLAGPRGAYRYWAMSAHQDIIDVAVYSIEPCVVNVRPLLKGGLVPDPIADKAILDAVAAMLDPEERRPDTDQVVVQPPEAVSYDLQLTYWIDSANAPFVKQIQQAVQQAVSEYRSWQRGRLGRDINPSKLSALCMAAGAKRVDIASPAFRTLERWQVAQEGTPGVNYGGLEDE
ncbi:baseplate assembly protein [Desulfocurvibacter africanus]|uniref:Baseplate J family protein n=1 Tax=Desulfocurvibacter africanus subsp. africanus str. Walvis Bay TaxID=690850 RepID=F3YY40_DESAF|nr:baseplate J/gp47 family protein [Desulfocurvibacter africanus]EGJ51816.1 Baseplate J family protein [Desulfocurvibacter africanus subsp. africanus str. Walvis Bay]